MKPWTNALNCLRPEGESHNGVNEDAELCAEREARRS